MRFEALMMANGAMIENNLLNVVGAGWEHYVAPLFPFGVTGTVAGVLVLEHDELIEPISLEVSVSAGSAEPRALAGVVVGGDRPQSRGDANRIAIAVPVAFVVDSPGVVVVKIRRDDDVLGEISFAIVDAIPEGL
jgi:hypothetical protein